MERSSYIVWLDEQAQIASFHPVEGYQRQTFACHAAFLSFLCKLQTCGYRFQ